jgi:hypothetical protein
MVDLYGVLERLRDNLRHFLDDRWNLWIDCWNYPNLQGRGRFRSFLVRRQLELCIVGGAYGRQLPKKKPRVKPVWAGRSLELQGTTHPDNAPLALCQNVSNEITIPFMPDTTS